MPLESLDANGIITNRPVMKNGAYVCADAALTGQCTIKGMNWTTYLFDVCDYGAVDDADSGTAMAGMTMLLESLFKLARRIRAASIFVASHNNSVITVVPPGITVDTQRVFPFMLQICTDCRWHSTD